MILSKVVERATRRHRVITDTAEAMSFATKYSQFVHRGQNRDHADEFLLDHIARTAGRVRSDEAKIVALLHMMRWQGNMSFLRENLPGYLVDAISVVGDDESDRVVATINANPLALEVKLACLEDRLHGEASFYSHPQRHRTHDSIDMLDGFDSWD